jgi:hypothetical protein
VIDDDGFPGLPDFVADGRLDLQFSARLETERDFIADAARYPAVLGNPRDRREAHAGRPAHHFEDRRHRFYAADGLNIGLKFVRHGHVLSGDSRSRMPAPIQAEGTSISGRNGKRRTGVTTFLSVAGTRFGRPYHILSNALGGKAMMAFWYHFAILFEALFAGWA